MLISNFNLNKPEWLELVFAKRNKEYGAYYIRQHYNENVNKAMAITFGAVALISISISVLTHHKQAEIVRSTVIDLKTYVKPPEPPHKAEIQHPKPTAPKLPPASTIKFVKPVVVTTPPPVEPPRLEELDKSAIGQIDNKVPGGITEQPIVDGKTGGKGDTPKMDSNEPYDPSGVDIMPEPYGGAAAWGKFLQKNLRYPPAALENNITGKVFVSFIIEKDGTLSSITILRGLGYGTDEEALRVLKKAPAWKPGKQNGQPVRVKYTLPLNFLLDSQ